MTGKEIVNLIRKLRKEGITDSKIIEIILYIETHSPMEGEDEDQDNVIENSLLHGGISYISSSGV